MKLFLDKKILDHFLNLNLSICVECINSRYINTGSPKSTDAQTKVELKIPQLTLAKIAQLGRHEIVNPRC